MTRSEIENGGEFRGKERREEFRGRERGGGVRRDGGRERKGKMEVVRGRERWR